MSLTYKIGEALFCNRYGNKSYHSIWHFQVNSIEK